MEAIRLQETITDQGLYLNNEELQKFVNQKVDIIILPLQVSDIMKKKGWYADDSLLKTKPLKLGKRNWTRDDLYEE